MHNSCTGLNVPHKEVAVEPSRFYEQMHIILQDTAVHPGRTVPGHGQARMLSNCVLRTVEPPSRARRRSGSEVWSGSLVGGVPSDVRDDANICSLSIAAVLVIVRKSTQGIDVTSQSSGVSDAV